MDDDYISDLFSSLGNVTTKRMFGGKGIYRNGMIIALVMSTGELLVKGDNESSPIYEAEGATKWTYQRPGQKASSMPYWFVPASIIDYPDEMGRWARLAYETALRVQR